MREIEAAVRKQGDKAAGLSVEDLEARAQALPAVAATLRGSVEVQLPGGPVKVRLTRIGPARPASAAGASNLTEAMR